MGKPPGIINLEIHSLTTYVTVLEEERGLNFYCCESAQPYSYSSPPQLQAIVQH